MNAPNEPLLHRLFEARASESPEATAVRFEGDDWTFAELNARANQLARQLQSLAVGPEVVVAILVDRSPEMLVGMLGTLKAGGAYLALDSEWPTKRLAWVLGDSDARVVLTIGRMQERLSQLSLGIPILALDSEWESIISQAAKYLAATVMPENRACVRYVSSASGPRSVDLLHGALSALSMRAAEVLKLGPGDNALQLAAPHSNAAREELFASWIGGATAVLAPADMRPNEPAFHAFLQDQNITSLRLSAADWVQWTCAIQKGGADLLPPVGLHLVAVDGDRVPAAALATWQSMVGDGVAWLHLYGSTETSGTVTVYAPQRELPPGTISVPIGKPLPGMEAEVIGPDGQPALDGNEGELYISGDYLARGQVSPFATGERVRRLPAGNLEYIGRLDERVQLAGERVELAEIASVLQEHHDVAECAPSVRAGSRLVAYMVPSGELHAPTAELRQLATERLPKSMQPSTYEWVEELPRNAEGRVDHELLPEPDLRREAFGIEYVPPGSALEECMAVIWSELLGFEPVGIRDELSKLGGNLTDALTFQKRLRADMNCHVQLADVIAKPTIEELASRVLPADEQATPAARDARTDSAPPQLPDDHEKPSQGLERSHIRLPHSTWQSVVAFSRVRQSTPEITLCAAFEALLMRLCDQSLLTLNTCVAGPDGQHTLPLQVNFAREETFEDHVAHSRDSFIDALEHGTPAPDNASVGFQVGANSDVPVGTTWSVMVLPPEGREDLVLECLIDTSRFELVTAERWLGNFGVLLADALQRPESSLWELALLTEEEEYLLHNVWNDTAADVSATKCTHELFEEQALRTPTATAVRCGTRSLNYRQLDERSNRLAHLLRTRDALRGAPVGICVDPSIEGVVALLGTLKAGCAFVPLDPTQPAQRLSAILHDADAQVLLSTESRLDEHSAWAASVIALDGDWEELFRTQGHSDPPQPRPTGEDIAFVCYPAAESAEPQGVVLQHCSLTNMITSLAMTPGLHTDDVLLGSRASAESIGILEHFLPLCTGAELAIAPLDVVRDGQLFAQEIERARATVVHAHASTWRSMLRSGWEGAAITVLVDGELASADADALSARVQSAWYLYGMAETGGCSAIHPLRGKGALPVIGRPIANTKLHVLDRCGHVLPVGIPGELYIAGAGVADGYLCSDERTLQKFLADPFSSEQACRLFRSGDRVRRLPDGTLERLGRLERRVEIDGLRVELAEIETHLLAHDDIEDAIVTHTECPDGGNQLIAYITTLDGATPTCDELHSCLLKALPEPSCPREFVTLARLPRTASGALDESAIAAP